jgi:hypothetical protein
MNMQMDIQPNEIVSIKHYSHKYSFKTTVIKTFKEYVYLELVKEFLHTDISQYDPVVMTTENNTNIKISAGIIETISRSNHSIEIQYNGTAFYSIDKEKETLPASEYGYITIPENRKKISVSISNLSVYNIKLLSIDNLPLNMMYDLSLCACDNVIFLNSTAIHKTDFINFFEYNMSIQYDEKVTIQYIKDLIHYNKIEHTSSIRRMKSLLV